MSRPPVPQPGQVVQKLGSGTAQPAHNGASRVPARIASHCRQREHCIQARAHARHHGCPVVLDTMQVAVRAQTLQVAVTRGTQLAQIGPSGPRVLTRCRRSQRTHTSRLSGSRTRQFGHNGPPCASRAAGSRTVPQPEQATALARAQQLRQIRSPSRRLLRATTRRQRGQAGGWMRVAPASRSASISRSTMGNGAFAPSPVSSSGAAWMAHASFWAWAGLLRVVVIAVATASAPSPGSSVVMIPIRICRGSRSSWSGHWEQRGRPCRSRKVTCRCCPHEAQGCGRV